MTKKPQFVTILRPYIIQNFIIDAFAYLIFPEKLVFSNYTFQTMQPNEILTLLCNGGKGFSPNEKGLSKNKLEKSCVVTALGFKPKTPSSVVRYSIQLSYAAIPSFRLDDKNRDLFYSSQLFVHFCRTKY